MTRKITAIFVGAALLALPYAQPAGAEVTAGGELGYIHVDEFGPQGRVRALDGRQALIRANTRTSTDYGNETEPRVRPQFIEADFWMKSHDANKLLDLGVTNLNSGSESAFIDLNLGQAFRLTGDLDVLIRRMPLTHWGMYIDGAYINNVDQTVGAANRRHYIVSGGEDLGDDLFVTRVQAQAKARYTLPTYPLRLSLGMWREGEHGSAVDAFDLNWGGAGTYSYHRYNLDRFTRQYTAAVETDIGEGTVEYSHMTRKFAEKGPNLVNDNETGNKGILPNSHAMYFQDHIANRNKVSFSYRVGPKFSVAGGVAKLSRRNPFNHYEFNVHSVHTGFAYRPTKTLSFSGRMYARDEATIEDLSSDQYLALGNKSNTMDFRRYKGDFKMRYTGIKSVAVTAGYKPEHISREHTDLYTQRWGTTYSYTDGTFNDANRYVNDVAGKNTLHRFSLGTKVDLPLDAQLDIGLKQLIANRSSFVSTPNRSSRGDATLTAPLGQQMQLLVGAGHLYEKNTKGYTRYKRKEFTALTGFTWTEKEGRGSMGINYLLEDGRDLSDTFWGDAAGTGNVHTSGRHAPYRYTNRTVSGNVMVKLPWETSVNGNASYTRSRSEWSVANQFDYMFNAAQGEELVLIDPSLVEITHFGLSIDRKFMKSMTARLRYDWNGWQNKHDKTLNGSAQIINLSLSGKFGGPKS
ncbi:MAG: hypothetical protein ABIJ96_01865 [Elusimicrobiota bacterium]